MLLGGDDTKVVGAVIIAGQKVDILRAEARVVVRGAGVDLALDGSNADIESATGSSVAIPEFVNINIRLRSTCTARRNGGGGLRSCYRGKSCENNKVLHFD